MQIQFFNKESNWIYNDKAVVALVGKKAEQQFRKFSLTVDEVESVFPFVCFDSPHIEIDREEVTQRYEDALKNRMELCKTDMLFVLSELESMDEIEKCLLYGEQLKKNGLSFLITHKRNRHRDDLVDSISRFSHIIFVEDDSTNLFYPAKQLLCDYYRVSYIGIDMADVFSVYPQHTRKESCFTRKSFSNIKEMKKYSISLLEDIERKKETPDLMFFIEGSTHTGIDEIENILYPFAEKYMDSQLIWSYYFDMNSMDESCTLTFQKVLPSKS